MSPDRRTSRIASHLALGLVLLAPPGAARAESPPGEDAAIAAEVAAALPPVALQPTAMPAPQTRPRFWLGRFVDHLDLGNRLSSIKSLKLVPLWDGRHLSIYFGVDHRGMTGLHIQQQDPGYVARLAAIEPPDVIVMPLRAVPLNSL